MCRLLSFLLLVELYLLKFHPGPHLSDKAGEQLGNRQHRYYIRMDRKQEVPMLLALNADVLW